MTMITPLRYPARNAEIGEGTTVRRALPNRALRRVGAWCFLNHAGPVQFPPGEGMHVGAHPHIGLQTFTWVIEGEVMHRDSLGYAPVIRPGEVNLLTAGHGIAHSEDRLVERAALHTAQLWIALPEAERHRAPSFRHYPDLPRSEDGGWQMTLLAGSALGQTAPTDVFSPLVGLDFVAASAARTEIALDPAFEHAALVLRGSAALAGEALAPGELLYFAPGCDALSLRCDEAAQVLLIGGAPLDEPILIWWNFVARTQAEMQQAAADWNAASPRFGTVRAGSPAPRLSAPALEGVKLQGG